MALDRWLALGILLIAAVYGYTAWFAMDGLLPPIMQRNPVWPSSFPKILSVIAVALSLAILLGLEKESEPKAGDINYRRLTEYKLVQALVLIAMMVAYALLLRPLGFIASTVLFLAGGSLVLGERRIVLTLVVAAVAAGSIWWLVDAVLGIVLRPLPSFL
ncbi:MAG: tripartite tricarboxylate transporter TctB family protein [Pseudomonadota bacterium]